MEKGVYKIVLRAILCVFAVAVVTISLILPMVGGGMTTLSAVDFSMFKSYEAFAAWMNGGQYYYYIGAILILLAAFVICAVGWGLSKEKKKKKDAKIAKNPPVNILVMVGDDDRKISADLTNKNFDLKIISRSDEVEIIGADTESLLSDNDGTPQITAEDVVRVPLSEIEERGVAPAILEVEDDFVQTIDSLDDPIQEQANVQQELEQSEESIEEEIVVEEAQDEETSIEEEPVIEEIQEEVIEDSQETSFEDEVNEEAPLEEVIETIEEEIEPVDEVVEEEQEQAETLEEPIQEEESKENELIDEPSFEDEVNEEEPIAQTLEEEAVEEIVEEVEEPVEEIAEEVEESEEPAEPEQSEESVEQQPQSESEIDDTEDKTVIIADISIQEEQSDDKAPMAEVVNEEEGADIGVVAAVAEEKTIDPDIDLEEVTIDDRILKARYKVVELSKRLCRADENIKQYYSELKNCIMSYKGVHCRMSKKFETFTIGRFVVGKMTVRGQVLKLYLALLSDSLENKYYVSDVSGKGTYNKTPTMHNVKSKRGCKYGIELITDIMEGLEIEKNPKYEPHDYAADYPAEDLEKMKEGIRHLMQESITVESCEVISDDEAIDYLVVEKNKAHTINKFLPINKYVIFLGDINDMYADGDTVTVESLIEKGALPEEENIFLEIRGSGTLSHKLHVEAHSFDMTAVKMILLTDGSLLQYK